MPCPSRSFLPPLRIPPLFSTIPIHPRSLFLPPLLSTTSISSTLPSPSPLPLSLPHNTSPPPPLSPSLRIPLYSLPSPFITLPFLPSIAAASPPPPWSSIDDDKGYTAIHHTLLDKARPSF
ncbi:hypothetical protein ACQY0O_004953 [Thecaphora frezii]